MPNRFLKSFQPQLKGRLTAAFTKPLWLSVAGLSVAIAASPTYAQTPMPAPAAPTPAPAAAPTTVCAYDPNGGVPNPLGMRAFITVSEIAGDSVFVYEQFPSPVSVSNPAAVKPATIANQRTLTLFATPIAEARSRVVADPTYYAELLGTSVASLGGEGFGPVNNTLVCKPGSGSVAAQPPATQPPATQPPTTQPPTTQPPATQPPTTQPPVAQPPAPSAPTLASLPDGNYRMTTAEYPFRVVSDEELLANGGYLFSFRKRGNAVVGIYGHIDHEDGACITGTVSGNTITGQAYTDDRPVTIDGQTYLSSDKIIRLGTPVSGLRYDNSVMTVDSLFRINAGTRVPPASCQGVF